MLIANGDKSFQTTANSRMANHTLVIFRKEVIKVDTFLALFMGAMTLFLMTHQQVGVSQGFNPQIDVALESLKNATNLLKDAEASTGLWFVTSCGLLLLSQDDLKALIVIIAVKRKAEEEDSSSKSTGFGGNKTAQYSYT